jgi:hypothetical protein
MTPIGRRGSSDLADYHAVIAADIKDFTSNIDIDTRTLARWLPQVMSEAFARSGLDFSKVKFPGQAGDGYVAGLDYHQLPHLIYPLLDCLQEVLAQRDAGLRAHDRRLRMRLRASIHIGPLPGDDDPVASAGIGKVMNDLHRLLDADSVRDALRRTDPDTTFVAAVISQRAYEDAIESGACALQASRLIHIPVHVKQFTGTAWLYVPEPSGQALHRAFTLGDPNSQAARSPADRVATPEQARGIAGSSALAPTFHIGSAGQVTGTVTSPVTIRQTIHSSTGMAEKPDTCSQPLTADSPAHNSSSGESS